MIKKIIKIISLMIVFLLFVGCICIAYYFSFPKMGILLNEKSLNYKKDTKEYNKCFKKMFSYLIVPKVLIYKYKTKVDDISFDDSLIKIDNRSRLYSYSALLKSNVFIIYNDETLVDIFNNLLKKPVYHFTFFQDFSRLFISNKNYIGIDKQSIEKEPLREYINSSFEKIEELNFKDKKVFLNLKLHPDEIGILNDILKYSEQITGMTIDFYIDDIDTILEVSDILENINNNFILVSRNTTNFISIQKIIDLNSFFYKGTLNNNIFTLSYINKNLLDSYSVMLNQKTKSIYKNYKYYYHCTEETVDPMRNYPYCGKVVGYKNYCIKLKNDFVFCNYPIDDNSINFMVPYIEKIKNN